MPTISEAIAHTDSPLASVKYLVQRCGGQLLHLSGHANARTRKDWMNYIGPNGNRYTQATSGFNALRAAVYAYARANGFDDSAATCQANRENLLLAWAEG